MRSLEQPKARSRTDSVSKRAVTIGAASCGCGITKSSWDGMRPLKGRYVLRHNVFAIHPHGLHMGRRRVGLEYDGRIMTGWGSMAKTHEGAETVIDRLNRGHEGVNIQ